MEGLVTGVFPPPLLQALYVPPGSPYRVYKPMKHGHLNINPHQSLRNLLDILEDLWTQAIKEVLSIEREEFKVVWSNKNMYEHTCNVYLYGSKGAWTYCNILMYSQIQWSLL